MLSEKIKFLANSLGIDIIGFTHAEPFSDYALPNHKRSNPKTTLPQAKSIIIAGIYIGGLAMPEWKNPWYGRTSRLYLSGFFLDAVEPIEPIADLLRNLGYQAIVCDGSRAGGSILPLKLAAIRAGLGWQGKHSLLINKKFGSFLALGGIITDAPLEHNTNEEPNLCHNCMECQKACPVGALTVPYVLNVGQCMSNLLAKENLPDTVIAVMDNRIGDCEICQDSCPWNKKHLKNPLQTPLTKQFRDRMADLRIMYHLTALSRLSPDEYDQGIGIPLNTGIPFHIFQRNVSIGLDKAREYARSNELPA